MVSAADHLPTELRALLLTVCTTLGPGPLLALARTSKQFYIVYSELSETLLRLALLFLNPIEELRHGRFLRLCEIHILHHSRLPSEHRLQECFKDLDLPVAQDLNFDIASLRAILHVRRIAKWVQPEFEPREFFVPNRKAAVEGEVGRYLESWVLARVRAMFLEKRCFATKKHYRLPLNYTDRLQESDSTHEEELYWRVVYHRPAQSGKLELRWGFSFSKICLEKAKNVNIIIRDIFYKVVKEGLSTIPEAAKWGSENEELVKILHDHYEDEAPAFISRAITDHLTVGELCRFISRPHERLQYATTAVKRGLNKMKCRCDSYQIAMVTALLERMQSGLVPVEVVEVCQ